MSTTASFDSARSDDGIGGIVRELAPAVGLGGSGAPAIPRSVPRPTWWIVVAGGLIPSLPAALLLTRTSGTSALVVTLVTLAVWSTLILLQEVEGRAGAASVVGRFGLLGRRAVALVAVLAVGGVVGLLSLGDVRTAIPALAVAVVGSVLVDGLRARLVAPQRLLLVGAQYDVEAYAARFADQRSVLLVGACVVVPERRPSAVRPLLVPTVRSLSEVGDLATEVGADAVVVVPGLSVGADEVRSLTWIFERLPVTVSIAAPIAAVAHHRMRPRSFGGETVIDLAVPRAGVVSRVGKVVLDRVGALVLLVLTAPLLLVVWAAVRWDSRGPGLFSQTRVGRNGVPFKMYKLRTMHMDAESMLAQLVAENESDGTLFKIRRDPRVTRLGYLLRRSSLDELPQLWNVLRGDMSLIGPRPALPTEVATYGDAALRRLAVLPGITGLWQVSGRSDLSWDESVRLDLYYADNWRLGDDVTIAMRTLSAVIRARGAY